MSGWSNEETMLFLEYYQKEPCIWNPDHVDHKDKSKVADAWRRLSELMQKPVKEIKSKKEILMATFRTRLKRKQKSLRSDADANNVYKPTWFAYETMETFLLPIYTRNSGNTETQSQQNAVPEEMEEAEEDYFLRDDNYTVNTPSLPTRSIQRSRRRPASDTVEQQIVIAFKQLSNVIKRRLLHEDDEVDLYCKLVAIKLRKLPYKEQILMMYKIDRLFLNDIDENSFIRHTPSPNFRQPSISSVVTLPLSVNSADSDRPSSTQTSDSEPIPNIKIEQQSAPSTPTSHSEPIPNIKIEQQPAQFTQTSRFEPISNIKIE